ncbi:hypothetical protein MMC25_001127 [Agyrium rufum]|nr:hypothetical protein [Agyrium rufum]
MATDMETPPGYTLADEKAVVTAPSTYIKPQARKMYDSAVTFEEYHHYALKTRALEQEYVSPKLRWRQIITRSRDSVEDVNVAEHENVPDHTEINFAKRNNRIEITDEEWSNASRAYRTASWGASFYLITTDILGPYGVGFAMGTLGWGPGIALYTVFGFFAGYSGYLIWHTFIGLDSYEFPCRNYGDLAFRTWGTTARYTTNIIQALALLLILGQVVIQYGQNISQVSQFKLCYAVCPLLFIVVGFFLTQIRTLKAYGLVANFAVWLNLLVIFISMGVIAHSPPNYGLIFGSSGGVVDPPSVTPVDGVFPPIRHFGGLPAPNLVGNINGLLSGVLAYAGAQLFVEFLAEMRRPNDFLKAMWGAQFFIYSVYLIYGLYVYHFQGQYSYQISYQGISSYGWQTACNMVSLIAALIAAGLYGNIGIKVFYNNVLMELFSAPPLITKQGKILYAIIVPIWWVIAYVIAAAIPDYFGFVAVISASCLLNLTYTLPPFLALGYDMQLRAIEADEGFDPNTGVVHRNATQFKRWTRGFFRGGPIRVGANIWHVIYFFASLAMSGLGMYAAVEGLIEAFASNQVNSFSCKSPLDVSG